MIGVTSVTKVKDLVTSTQQNLKTLAANAKLKFATNKQKASDDLFRVLKVSNVERRPLESKQFQQWADSVAKTYKKDPEVGTTTMVSTLLSHYDDASVANMLAAAGKVTRTKDVAKSLEGGLFTNWIIKERSADDVFTLLKLNKEGDKIFQSPVWNTWVSYVTKLDNKNPNQLMFKVLRKHYDDETLARALATAAENYETKGIAGKLEELQRASWLNSDKTADDVFNILKLNMNGDELFRSNVVNTWISYVKSLEKDPYELLLLKLAKRYDDEALANMLHQARRNYRTEPIATDIANAQLNSWRRNGKSADDVFNILKMKEEGAQFLESPLLSTWISYVTKLDQDPYQLMFLKLTKHYDDEGLLKILIEAKKGFNTKTIAAKLEEIRLETWLSTGKTPSNTFNLLGLNKEGDKLFESPVFSTWLSYLAKVNAANPDESMFLVLKAHYGDKGMEKMITIANANKRTESIASKLKEEVWRNQGKSDDDIFNIFKLKERRGDMFKTTEYAAWASYATKLNKLDKNPNEFVLVEKLKEHFGDVGLARVLAKTKMASFQDKETLKIVSDLQTQQFKQWWSDGKDNEAVSIMLIAAKFDPWSDTRIVLDFADFYKAKGPRLHV
ncbi:Hypothetical protein PHPALM_345 [Phytophthora palmivora]|uniref:RxLR effector PexRD54 WY domain-containing protein n=1 Tax=Phytophthora palmivora TaxID=4796 RepID=A0A2P4YV29_9STRA|nr:Hypothetical protein PHPALM_345 [Phytophthora palmivora]